MQVSRLALWALLAVMPAGPVAAETLGTFQDWAALKTGSGKAAQCYALTKAKTSTPAKPKRDSYITVTVRAKGAVEVNMVAGVPWKAGSDVKLTATGVDFALFTKGDGAWAYDADTDKAIATAFGKGKTVVVTGPSAKGETVTDTFSLAGFSDALAKAIEGCK